METSSQSPAAEAIRSACHVLRERIRPALFPAFGPHSTLDAAILGVAEYETFRPIDGFAIETLELRVVPAGEEEPIVRVVQDSRTPATDILERLAGRPIQSISAAVTIRELEHDQPATLNMGMSL